MRCITFICLLALAGCKQAPSGTTAQTDGTAEWRYNSLRSDIGSLRDQMYKRPGAFNDTAWLSPTEDGFSFLNTEIGALALSVVSVKPLGDGSEVYIRFGNPTSATIQKLTFHAQWGPVDKKGDLIEAEAVQADKTIEGPLLGGAWNGRKVKFSGVPPQKLGRIIVSKPSVANISLSGS